VPGVLVALLLIGCIGIPPAQADRGHDPYKPSAPVLINSNRYDPLVPWTAANQLGRDWCALGADVEFRTNEEPPFLNKLVVNHALPMLVDGESAMGWIADRFNGLPTTPNCGQF
jgi:triacylglycerol lipase